jgi:CheY-like chemotaxis protein
MTASTVERTPRILIVDDYPEVADGLAALFRKLDCTVRVVYLSENAVAEAIEFLPDCILSDISMPVIDGYELAERLRSEPLFQRIRIVAHTASADERRAKTAGFDRLLLKPVSRVQLLALLEELRPLEETHAAD